MCTVVGHLKLILCTWLSSLQLWGLVDSDGAACSRIQVQGSLAAGGSRPVPALVWEWVATGPTGKPEGNTVEAGGSATAQEGCRGAQLPEAGAQRGGRCAQWSWPVCQVAAARHQVEHGQAAGSQWCLSCGVWNMLQPPDQALSLERLCGAVSGWLAGRRHPGHAALGGGIHCC